MIKSLPAKEFTLANDMHERTIVLLLLLLLLWFFFCVFFWGGEEGGVHDFVSHGLNPWSPFSFDRFGCFTPWIQ